MGGTKWLDTLWSGVLCSRGFSDVDPSPLSLLFKVRMVGLMGGGRWDLSVIGGTGGGGTFVWWGGGGTSIQRQAVPLSQNNKRSYRETLTPSLDPAITIPVFLSQRRDPAMSMSLLSAHLEQISISCQGIDSLP